jgi:hypothetical protein
VPLLALHFHKDFPCNFAFEIELPHRAEEDSPHYHVLQEDEADRDEEKPWPPVFLGVINSLRNHAVCDQVTC